MANIPPHYTDRFILQRYNKALHFVQHLPASSSFQPSKSQKLEVKYLVVEDRNRYERNRGRGERKADKLIGEWIKKEHKFIYIYLSRCN